MECVLNNSYSETAGSTLLHNLKFLSYIPHKIKELKANNCYQCFKYIYIKYMEWVKFLNDLDSKNP